MASLLLLHAAGRRARRRPYGRAGGAQQVEGAALAAPDRSATTLAAPAERGRGKGMLRAGREARKQLLPPQSPGDLGFRNHTARALGGGGGGSTERGIAEQDGLGLLHKIQSAAGNVRIKLGLLSPLLGEPIGHCVEKNSLGRHRMAEAS
eukprot:8679312-Pyramimonas_sp.AAC.1